MQKSPHLDALLLRPTAANTVFASVIAGLAALALVVDARTVRANAALRRHG